MTKKSSSSSSSSSKTRRACCETVCQVKWLVSGTALCVVLAHPGNVDVAGFLVGAILNAIAALVLKRVLNVARPEPLLVVQQPEQQPEQPPEQQDTTTKLETTTGTNAKKKKKLGPGMPSSHAMSLFYFAVYLSLQQRFGGWLSSGSSSSSSSPNHSNSIIIIIVVRVMLLTAATLATYSRVRRRLHTAAQCVVGAALGSCSAAAMHWCAMPRIRRWHANREPPLWQSLSITLFSCAVAAIVLERSLRQRAKAAILQCQMCRSKQNVK
jgi:membrane-associated phospholipid phosphatase